MRIQIPIFLIIVSVKIINIYIKKICNYMGYSVRIIRNINKLFGLIGRGGKNKASIRFILDKKDT
jgi:hypothetical protein